jgi:hypothetical protein
MHDLPPFQFVTHTPIQPAPVPQLPFQYHPPPGPMGHRLHNTPLPSPLGHLPKLNFPVFDGDSPKLWQSRCEDYFHMYGVDPSLWIQVATMQCTGPAAR